MECLNRTLALIRIFFRVARLVPIEGLEITMLSPRGMFDKAIEVQARITTIVIASHITKMHRLSDHEVTMCSPEVHKSVPYSFTTSHPLFSEIRPVYLNTLAPTFIR